MRIKILILTFFCMILLNACFENNNKNGGKIGLHAPEISAKNVKGQKVKISDFNNLVILTFVQQGCASCLKDLPLLEKLADDNPQKITILAVDSIDKDIKFKDFVNANDYKNIIFLEDDLDISWQRFNIFAVPTTFIIKNGIVQDKIIGEKPWSYLKNSISSWL
ncbi:TlpA family protein disulfide reductase [Campylobacter insulaenigrae]|uniref:TlpA family protein disulfide reductase n=1 Tax=Campylobacter insulaenigrae TaxID=260714 RepID=UPI002153342F|nr:TlpA disulfide reductase family protein [Campylobacter insulaenigrae]MCR6584170.1 TlpA family protein disulfide reductase [Campylobacter insulaenigrae]